MKINKIMVVLLVFCSLLSVYSLLVVNSKTKEAEAQCVDLWQPGMYCGLTTQDSEIPKIKCLGRELPANDWQHYKGTSNGEACPPGFLFAFFNIAEYGDPVMATFCVKM